MNGSSNGTTVVVEGEASNWKKLRESRLRKEQLMPSRSSIKIEDDSDEDSETNKANVAESIDKSVQTDNVALVEMLRQIVQERMRQYEVAAATDKFEIDKELTPKLEKLERENEELRKYASVLKGKLDLKDKEKGNHSLKRPYEDVEASSLLEKSLPATATHTPLCSTVSMANNATVTSTGTIIATRMLAPRQIRPQTQPPPLLSANPLQPRAGNILNNSRVPALTNNLMQIPPVQPFPRNPFVGNERFLLVNNNMPVSGVSTHVVSSNPGLRMNAPVPPIMNTTRPALDPRSRIFNPVPPRNITTVNAELYNQFLQGIPSGTILNTQLRPSQNTVRPLSHPPQQPRPPQLGNINNVAFPSHVPLPKLTANISTSNNAIVLTWDYDKTAGEKTDQYKVECYQLFAHQAKDARVTPPKNTKQWKKIGVVNALPLPMACTLTQFASGSVYFFAVVAVGVNGKEGEMSNPCVIRLDVNR